MAEKYAAWSPYNYVMGNPIKYIDPDGKEAVIPPLVVVGIIWAGVEIALSAYDTYDVATTLADPNASAGKKATSVGLYAAGLFLPGGGYTAVDDIIEGVAKYSDEALNAVKGGDDFYARADEAGALIKDINNKYNPGAEELNGGALSSAISSASRYENVTDQGSAIFNSIVGHMFYNGNKRTATEFITAFAKSNNLKFNLTTEDLQKLTTKMAKSVDEGGVRYTPEELSKILFKTE